ncbi:hypothetical protein AHAS_Ahas03G0137600 [Arachis hypogaea]
MTAAGAANASKQFVTTSLYIGIWTLRSMRTSTICSTRSDKWFRMFSGCCCKTKATPWIFMLKEEKKKCLVHKWKHLV